MIVLELKVGNICLDTPMPINPPSYGVIVGRFQVPSLHEGHIELLKKVESFHHHVILFLGVAPGGASTHNPLDYDTRRIMIQHIFPNFIVLPIADCSSDKVWSDNLDKKIAEIVSYGNVTLYGGRDSFKPHYRGKHTPYMLDLKVSVNGTDIRNLVTDRVQGSKDFREGVIYSINNMFPRVVTCVDVAILHKGEDETCVLLGRKLGEKNWRFVGGHAEPTSSSFEIDVKREAFEETALRIDSITYIGSRLVDDWRWRSAPDKIKTLFFVGYSMLPTFEARDDINELRWFGMDEDPEMVNEHIPLFRMLSDWWEKEND